jgi:hypothetical protein
MTLVCDMSGSDKRMKARLLDHIHMVGVARLDGSAEQFCDGSVGLLRAQKVRANFNRINSEGSGMSGAARFFVASVPSSAIIFIIRRKIRWHQLDKACNRAGNPMAWEVACDTSNATLVEHW